MAISFFYASLAAAVAAAPSYMLDPISANVIGAYGLTRLLTSYTGALVQATNGTTTTDIGFTAGGSIDETALLALGSSVWVTKWYDQSGGGFTLLPRGGSSARNIIVTSGVVNKTNGKPSIHCGVVNDGFALPSTLLTVTVPSKRTGIITAKQTPSSGGGCALLVVTDNVTGDGAFANPYNDSTDYGAFYQAGYVAVSHPQSLVLETKWLEGDIQSGGNTVVTHYQNSVSQVSSTGASATTLATGFIYAANYGECELSQFVMLNTALSSGARLTLQTALTSYYSTL